MPSLKSRFSLTTLAIVLVLLVMPIIRHSGALGWLAGSLLIALVPLSGLVAFARERHRVVLILALGAPFVILDGLALVVASPIVHFLTLAFGTGLYAYIVVALLREILARQEVTADMIYCAISIYLLIGIAWSGVYGMVELLAPGSFAGLKAEADMVYFSFVALTTVGFGDIAPVSVLARRLAVLEAAMGSIYMAIIVAMIVGRYLSREIAKGGEEG